MHSVHSIAATTVAEAKSRIFQAMVETNSAMTNDKMAVAMDTDTDTDTDTPIAIGSSHPSIAITFTLTHQLLVVEHLLLHAQLQI